MDKCLIFSNLELPHFRLQDMKIKPLIQLREMISKALSGQTNLSKSFQSFFIETMELILTHTGRLNFTQMARCGRSCESRFRQNFKKSFDWLSFNRSFLESTKGHRIAIAIYPCYISKSGKKTPGIDWFWSGCAAAMKKGLEILGISIVDADAKDSVFLKAEQTFTDKKRGRKPDCTKGMKDPDSLTGWYLRMLNRNCKQLLSICKLIVADAYFSKESFVSGVKSLGFNLISRFRDDVNLARAFARQQGMVLSVGSTKTLLHNAAMVDRFIAMSGKTPNMRLNNTDFKELLFYGVRAAV